MNLLVAICLLALTASTKADGLGLGGLGGQVYAPQHASVDYYAYPRYAFEYSVKDPHTGDNKAQWERRDGDVVKGAYSLVEPDGSLRVVEYHADDKSGFNAVVKRLGPNLHPATVHHAEPIYKAHIPVLSGLGSGLSPISVGPVANLGHLASAPLISGPIHGGPIYGPSLSTQNLFKEPVIVKSHPTPILPEPIIHEPIIQAPIIKGPIFREPYIKAPVLPGPIYNTGPIVTEPYLLEPNLKGPILPGPIYKSGPILPGPQLNEPILKGLPGPIYQAGPIYSEPLGPLPDYRAPLSIYNKHVPIQRERLPALPLLKEPVGLLGKGALGSLNWEGLGRGPLSYGYGSGKGIGPVGSLESYVPLRANIGPAHGGLLGKGPISSIDWEGLGRGQLVAYGLGKEIGSVRPSLEGHVPLRANIGPPQLGLLGKGPISSIDWEGLGREQLLGGYGLGKGIGLVRPSHETHVPLRANIGPAQLGLYGNKPITSVDWEGPRELVAGHRELGPLGPSLEGYGLLKGNIGPILPYAGLEKAPLPSWNGPLQYPLYPSNYEKH